MKVSTLVFFFLATVLCPLMIPVDTSGQIIISEFRLRGPGGASDEFIEVYNNSGADHTVNGGGTGYAIAASNGLARCIIPNGTIFPNKGHWLCVNSVGYSLASYPAGNGSTATGNATYTTEIPNNAGLAIFNTSIAANFTLANRMDAVGSTAEANTLYKEGTGYPALTSAADMAEHSLVRDECGKSGSISTFAQCVIFTPKDTNNNAADFIFVDTAGISAGAGQRLGAPGPENLSSPLDGIASYTMTPVDPCFAAGSAPNRVRNTTPDPGNNSNFGTIEFRFRVVNNTGANVTRMRYRIIDLTTFPAISGIADLRVRSSTAIVVTRDGAPCGSGTSNITVQGTTLEGPPGQANGGGFNSTLSLNTVTNATPVPNGASIDVRLVMGVQQRGAFRFGVILESLTGGGVFHHVRGHTESSNVGRDTPVDFDGDGETDISIFRPSNGQWWHRASTNGNLSAATFGVSSDITMPGDYSGDGKTDRAVYRPSTGQWFVLRSEDSTMAITQFGISSDLPAPGDFDGDGKWDLAVFRPSAGDWFISRSQDLGVTIAHWGSPGDFPVSADYDGDTKADLAIWRPNPGQWWISYSNGGTFATAFGSPTDKAVPGRWTADGKVDIAIWRPSNGTWFVLRSEDFSFFAFGFGVSTDIPSPGDYDGDGKLDACVFRPSTSQWFTLPSAVGGVGIQTFGLSSDQSLPNAFVP